MALKYFGAKVLKMFKEKPGVLFILCFLYIVYIIYCIASKSRKLFMKKCIYLWYSRESEKYFPLIFIISNVLRNRIRERQRRVKPWGTRGICPVPNPLSCFSGRGEGGLELCCNSAPDKKNHGYASGESFFYPLRIYEISLTSL